MHPRRWTCRHRESQDARLGLGKTHLSAGRTAEATAAFERVIEIDGTNYEAHDWLGKILAGQQRFPEAIAAFRRGIDAANRSGGDAIGRDVLHHGLATVLLSTGQVREGIVELNRAAAINPDNPLVQNDLGLVFEGSGQPDRALEHYRRALELDPGLAVAAENVRRVESNRGRK